MTDPEVDGVTTLARQSVEDLAEWTPRFAITMDRAVQLVEQKREFMTRVMRKDEHYGVIPGTRKPTLYKPGAELLLSSMGLHPRYRDTAPAIEDWTGAEHGGEPFFRYRKTCMITRQTGPGPNDYVVIADAGGNCNSREKKYRYRNAQPTCPACGKSTIIRGKTEFGGGWLCWKKKDGCGEKFAINDPRIASQESGQIANPDVADLANTIEKMADKRALVAATLLATGCSDIFTQDIEDMPQFNEESEGEKSARRPRQRTPQGSDQRQGGSDSPPSTVIQETAAAVTPAEPSGEVGDMDLLYRLGKTLPRKAATKEQIDYEKEQHGYKIVLMRLRSAHSLQCGTSKCEHVIG